MSTPPPSGRISASHLAAESRHYPAVPAGSPALLILAAAGIVTPLVYSNALSQGFDLSKGLVAQGGVLAFIWVWLSLGGGPRSFSLGEGSRKFWLPLLGFLVWSWTSLAWTPDPFGAVNRAFHWTLCAAALVLIGLAAQATASRLLLARAIVAGALMVAGFGLINWWVDWGFVTPAGSRSSTMGNPNWAAEILVLAGPAAVALVLVERQTAGRWLASLGLGCIAAYLFHTSSAACWLAFGAQVLAAGAVVAWPRARRQLRLDRSRMLALSGGTMLAVVLLFITPAGLQSPLTDLRSEMQGKLQGVEALRTQTPEEIRQVVGSPSNVTRRADFARRAWWLAQEKPWRGVGLAGFESAYRTTGLTQGNPPRVDLYSRLAHPHNDLLQILAELGWIGLGLALAALLGFLFLAVRAVRASLADPGALPVALGALLGLLGFGICGLFAYPLFTSTATFYAALLAGLVLSLVPAAAPRAFSRRLLWPVLLGATLAWTLWSGRTLFIARHVGDMAAANRAGDSEKVVRLVSELSGRNLGRRDYLPYGVDAWLKLGNAQAALALVEDFLERYPADANALMLAAQASQLNGDPDRALARINLALRLIPELPEPWRIRAGLHLQTGNLDATIADLETAVRLAPTDAQHLAMLGTLLVSRGVRLDEAVELIERAMGLDAGLRTDATLAEFLTKARRRKPAP